MDTEMKKKLEEAGMTDVISSIEGLEQSLASEKEGRSADAATHAEQMRKKTEEIVGARKHFKKLSEMNEEERNNLSEQEIEIRERQEALEEDQRKAEEQRRNQEEVFRNERVNMAIRRIAGDNAEIAERVRKNYDRIKDSESAITEDAISGIANEAFNMLGVPAPEGVSNAIAGIGTGGHMTPPVEKDFSQTEQGKGLSNLMGLKTEEPKA